MIRVPATLAPAVLLARDCSIAAGQAAVAMAKVATAIAAAATEPVVAMAMAVAMAVMPARVREMADSSAACETVTV